MPPPLALRFFRERASFPEPRKVDATSNHSTSTLKKLKVEGMVDVPVFAFKEADRFDRYIEVLENRLREDDMRLRLRGYPNASDNEVEAAFARQFGPMSEYDVISDPFIAVHSEGDLMNCWRNGPVKAVRFSGYHLFGIDIRTYDQPPLPRRERLKNKAKTDFATKVGPIILHITEGKAIGVLNLAASTLDYEPSFTIDLENNSTIGRAVINNLIWYMLKYGAWIAVLSDYFRTYIFELHIHEDKRYISYAGPEAINGTKVFRALLGIALARANIIPRPTAPDIEKQIRLHKNRLRRTNTEVFDAEQTQTQGLSQEGSVVITTHYDMNLDEWIGIDDFGEQNLWEGENEAKEEDEEEDEDVEGMDTGGKKDDGNGKDDGHGSGNRHGSGSGQGGGSDGGSGSAPSRKRSRKRDEDTNPRNKRGPGSAYSDAGSTQTSGREDATSILGVGRPLVNKTLHGGSFGERSANKTNKLARHLSKRLSIKANQHPQNSLVVTVANLPCFDNDFYRSADLERYQERQSFPSLPTFDAVPALQVTELAGSGGTGITYKATLANSFDRTRTEFAIKVVDADLRDSEEYENCCDELRAEYVNYCVLQKVAQRENYASIIARHVPKCYGLYQVSG
ncbi:uncharacterized protein FOMMEDRAFT_24493, partial [Fomitiporia mediterranea MF3/22]